LEKKVEAIIVIVVLVVLTGGAVLAERATTAGDPARLFRLSRGASSASIVFAFTWIAGLILNFPLVEDFAIVCAVATAAVAWDTARQLGSGAKK
jgi:hypothetical protein